MFRKILRDYDYRSSLVGLCVVVSVILAAICFGVLRVTGSTLVLLFLLLGGWECLWTVARRSSHEKIDKALDEAEEKQHLEKTRDNPTLR